MPARANVLGVVSLLDALVAGISEPTGFLAMLTPSEN
jgi:hypothetical protein